VAYLGLKLWDVLNGVVGVIDASGAVPAEMGPTTEAIGYQLMDPTGYLLPFEVVAVLLLVVLVGACTLARPRDSTEEA
jgi:NADH:ubiquinone oxidoreductase subunit 6 (subunit J)